MRDAIDKFELATTDLDQIRLLRRLAVRIEGTVDEIVAAADVVSDRWIGVALLSGGG
jgi:hypothetical protein